MKKKDKQEISILVEPTRLLQIRMTKEEYKKQFTLRGRIGIYILRIIGIIEVEII